MPRIRSLALFSSLHYGYLALCNAALLLYCEEFMGLELYNRPALRQYLLDKT